MSTAKQAPAPGVSSAALGKQEVFESDPDTLPGVPKKAEPVRQVTRSHAAMHATGPCRDRISLPAIGPFTLIDWFD